MSEMISKKEAKHWKSMPDGHATSKKVGVYRIELFYSTDRGGMIRAWHPGYEKLEHIWPPSPDKKWHMDFEVHFMDWRNAKSEYKKLKNLRSILDLWRQSDE